MRVVLPEPVPPLMIPFFFLPISSTTVSRTCAGILPDSISSSDVYQRLNFRMVTVSSDMEVMVTFLTSTSLCSIWPPTTCETR